MSFLDKVTDVVRRILGVKKKQLVSKVMKDSEVEQLTKDIEAERGYKEGHITALEEEVKDLKQSFAPKGVNIAEYLTKQKRALYLNGFKQSLSLKQLFIPALLRGKNIKIESYNSKKVFGELHDILVKSDGRFVVVVNNKGKNNPIMVGKSAKDIFTDYEGLVNQARRGYIKVNLDESGRFVPNMLQEEIPDIIVDLEGKYHISQVRHDSFIKKIIEKEEVISELLNMLSAYEESFQKITGNKNILKLVNKFNESRASTAETELVRTFKGVEEIHKNYGDLIKDISTKGTAQYLNESKIEKLEDMQELILGKMIDELGQPPNENAKNQFMRIAEWVTGVMQGGKVNVIVPPQQKAEIAGTLTEKFKKM